MAIQIEPLTILDQNYRDLLAADVDPIVAQQMAARHQRAQVFYKDSQKHEGELAWKERMDELAHKKGRKPYFYAFRY